MGYSVLFLRLVIRPDQFTLLFYTIFLVVLFSRHKMMLWVLVPIYLIWLNTHGFFIIGIGLVSAYLLSRWIETFFFKDKWEDFDRRVVALLLILGVSSFFTPYGIKMILYPLGVIKSFLSGQSHYLVHNIMELRSPFFDWRRREVIYSIVLSLLAFVATFSRKPRGIFSLITLIVTTPLSLFSWRTLFLLPPLCMIIIADRWKVLLRRLRSIITPRGLKFAAVLLILAASFRSGNFYREIRFFSTHGLSYLDYHNNLHLITLFRKRNPSETPQDMMDFIKHNPLPGRIFNTFNIGALLIYNLYPQHHVFIDGRADFYGKDFFSLYEKIMEGNDKAITEAVNKYKLRGFIIDFSSIPHKLVAALFRKRYICVYLSKDGIIFMRDIPQNKQYILQHRLDLNKFIISPFPLEEISLNRPSLDRYVDIAEVLFIGGFYERAKRQLEEILTLAPGESRANYLMAEIYYHQGEVKRAFIFARRSLMFNPRRREAYLLLARIYIEKYNNQEKARDILGKIFKRDKLEKEIEKIQRGDIKKWYD